MHELGVIMQNAESDILSSREFLSRKFPPAELNIRRK